MQITSSVVVQLFVLGADVITSVLHQEEETGRLLRTLADLNFISFAVRKVQRTQSICHTSTVVGIHSDIFSLLRVAVFSLQRRGKDEVTGRLIKVLHLDDTYTGHHSDYHTETHRAVKKPTYWLITFSFCRTVQ